MIEPARKLRELALLIPLALILPLASPALPGAVEIPAARDAATPAADLGEVMRPEEAEAGSLLLRTETGLQPAPMLATGVEIAVTGMIARAVVTQRFHNPATDWVEGVYVFPLPDGAAVDGLRMIVGDRVIEGDVQTRKAAKRTYAKARKEGRKASLLEQERPNIFTTSVANIGPGEDVEVVIHYQESLRYDGGRFSLRFPMVVGPRFIPGATEVKGFEGTGWARNTDVVPDAACITPPVVHPDSGPINPVTIRVELDTGFALPLLKSSSHPVAVRERGGDRYVVTLAEGAVPADSDFTLEWQPAVGEAPAAALFSEERDGERYVLVMVMPPDPEKTSRRLPRETIFVIDTSGSMAGASIVQAKAALALALQRLQPEDRFNVIRFASSTQALFPTPVPADTRNVEHASQWVAALQASGGTQMLPALQAALATPAETGRVRQVIFATDGSVGNEDQLFGFLHHHLGQSRLFPIGIGSAPNSHFMTKSAEFGRGTFTTIGSPGEVGAKMGALFAKLESPVLADLRVAWDDRHVDAWPNRVPDLYRGEPVVLAARLPAKHGGELVLRGTRGKEVWKTQLALNGGAVETGVARLWARRKVKALMSSLHEGADAAEVKQGVSDLGLQFHLVTKYTSLVAVDVTPTAPIGVDPATRALPTNLPKGWTFEGVFGGKGSAAPTGTPGGPVLTQAVHHVVPTSQGRVVAGRMPQTATPAALLLWLGSGLCGAGGLGWLVGRRRHGGVAE